MTETARELWWPHHPSRNRETALAALDSGDTGEVTLEYADFAAISDLLDDAMKALETAVHDEAWNAEMESRSEGSWMGQARATLAKLRSKP